MSSYSWWDSPHPKDLVQNLGISSAHLCKPSKNCRCKMQLLIWASAIALAVSVVMDTIHIADHYNCKETTGERFPNIVSPMQQVPWDIVGQPSWSAAWTWQTAKQRHCTIELSAIHAAVCACPPQTVLCWFWSFSPPGTNLDIHADDIIKLQVISTYFWIQQWAGEGHC